MEGRQSFDQGTGPRALQGRSGLACKSKREQGTRPPMKRVAIWTLMFCITVLAGQARSADDGMEALDNCFKASRLGDAICSNTGNPPEQRSECFQNVQAA